MRRRLHLAAEEGDHETILMLLGRGADVNKRARRSGHGKTALMYAAIAGQLSSLTLLLDSGADPNIADDDGATALMYAARAAFAAESIGGIAKGQPAAVSLLLERGASVQARDTRGRTPLFYAGPETIGLLLQAGAEVNARDNEDATPLLPDRPHTDLTRILLENGADVRVRNARGDTALINALMLYLLDHSLDQGLSKLDAVRSLDENTLEFPEDLVLVLLQHGVDIDAHGDRGDTALIRAATNGLIEVVWLLLKYGANLEARDDEGRTALMCAALRGRRGIVRLLLDHGADPRATDHEGNTALALAHEAELPETVKMLRAADG